MRRALFYVRRNYKLREMANSAGSVFLCVNLNSKVVDYVNETKACI